MAELFMNLQSGVLTADPGAAGTSLASGNFAFLPAIAAPNYMRLVLNPDGLGGTAPEIVIVTAHTAFTTTVTVLRAQETSFGGGPGVAHPIDSVWRHTFTRQSILEMLVQPGVIQSTIAPTPDVGFVFIDGSTIAGGQTLYPLTWARIPASWQSAPNIVLPDWRGRMLVSDDAGALYALGGTAGAMSKTIAQANLPAATITIDPPALSIDPPSTVVSIDPPATAVTGSTGALPPLLDSTIQFAAGGGATPVLTAHATSYGSLSAGTLAVDIPAFNATVDIAPFNVDAASFQSGNLGSGTALDVTPASAVVNWQLKVT